MKIRKRRRIPFLILIGTILLCSCAGTAPADTAEEKTAEILPTESPADDSFRNQIAEPIPTAEPTSQPTASPTPQPPVPTTLGCVGDVYLSSALYDYYVKADCSCNGFLKNGLTDCLQNVDIMLANHEFASTDASDDHKDPRQIYNFRAPTEREFLWNEMGVDVVSLANNHALDFGRQSLLDTLNILDAREILHCGAGTDLEDALKAAIIEKNGKKIAILAASRVVVNVDWYATDKTSGVLTTYESTPYFQIIKDEITRLKEEEQCDFVAIYVHFGEEGENQFRDYQETVAHGYIDAGADLVLGSHAHTLQGIEIYNRKPIFYNLGNFLFTGFSTDSLFVEVTILEDNSCTVRIRPCVTKGYIATLCQDEEKQRLLQFVEQLSKNVRIDEEGNVFEADVKN